MKINYIKRIIIYLFIILILGYFIYFGFKIKSSASDVFPITNQISYNLPIRSERYSDLTITTNRPDKSSDTFVIRADSNGNANAQLRLGTKSDLRDGCNIIIETRRTGKCEDGIYNISVTSTDGAGNTSVANSIKIERDTVSPLTPAGELSICGNNICLNLNQAEYFSDLYSNDAYIGKLPRSNPATFIVINNFKQDTKYDFDFLLKDSAGNSSDKLFLSIHTPSFGIGGVDNPYSDKTLEQFKKTYNSEFSIGDDGKLRLDKLDLMAPIITYANTDFVTEEVNIWGISPSKNFPLNTNAKINVKTIQYGDAHDKCALNMFEVPVIPWNQECMANEMKITKDQFKEFEKNGLKECLFSRSVSSVLNYYNPNAKHNCMKEKRFTKTIEQANVLISLSNVELNLLKDNNDITQNRICDIGAACFNESKRYWHDNSEGKWQMKFTKEALVPGNKVNAKYTFYTDFSLDIEGQNFSGSNSEYGYQSPLSNEYEVPKGVVSFPDPVGFPFRNFRLDGRYSKYFGDDGSTAICNVISCDGTGERGDIKISRGANESGHPSNAMDFAPYKHDYSSPFVITSTVDGSFIFDNKSIGNSTPYLKNGKWVCNHYDWLSMTLVNETNKKTIFGHLDAKSTNISLLNSNNKIKRGDVIGFIGNTGCSSGPHLHYEIEGYNSFEFYNSFSNPMGINFLPENITDINNKDKVNEYINNYFSNKSDIEVNF